MERKEILKELKKYFNVKELVDTPTYKKFGENSWRFLDDKLLHIILILRTQILKVPMIVNNGSNFTQRGLRSNMCQIVKGKKNLYLSPHVLGKAVDFDAKGMSAEQVRKKIKDNINIIPYNFRLEINVNWVHIDCIDMDNGKKLTLFTD